MICCHLHPSYKKKCWVSFMAKLWLLTIPSHEGIYRNILNTQLMGNFFYHLMSSSLRKKIYFYCWMTQINALNGDLFRVIFFWNSVRIDQFFGDWNVIGFSMRSAYFFGHVTTFIRRIITFYWKNKLLYFLLMSNWLPTFDFFLLNCWFTIWFLFPFSLLVSHDAIMNKWNR